MKLSRLSMVARPGRLVTTLRPFPWVQYFWSSSRPHQAWISLTEAEWSTWLSEVSRGR